MIHIEYPRECEITFNKLNKESIRLDDEEIYCSNDTAATTLNSDITPISPVSRKNSSLHFNKRLSSSISQDYSDQLNTQNLLSNKQQKSVISNDCQQDGQDEKIYSNSTNQLVKNYHILSPTPLKAINFSQSMQNYSTSYSQASNLSSSSSSSSQSSSQFSQYSSISSIKKKEQQQKRNLGQQKTSCSYQKIMNMMGKNLYHSDDEQDCAEEIENTYFQKKQYKRDNMQKSKCKDCYQQDQHSNKSYNNHHYFQEDNYDQAQNIFTQISEPRIRTKLFSQNQITQFTLDTNTNTAINNINTTINSTNNTSSNSSDCNNNRISGTNIPFQHNFTLHLTTSQNEISQDEIMTLECSIERNNAQNPQSKDEMFLQLNQNSFSEDIQEQYKEFQLFEL